MANIIECTSCRAEILSPSVPKPGSLVECPNCMIMHNDMTQSGYVKNLINFLKRRGYIINVTRAKGSMYNITGAKKGEEPKLIATIEFIAKDNTKLMMPNLAIADIRIKSGTIKDITEFKIKFGLLADIPLAPLRSF